MVANASRFSFVSSSFSIYENEISTLQHVHISVVSHTAITHTHARTHILQSSNFRPRSFPFFSIFNESEFAPSLELCVYVHEKRERKSNNNNNRHRFRLLRKWSRIPCLGLNLMFFKFVQADKRNNNTHTHTLTKQHSQMPRNECEC